MPVRVADFASGEVFAEWRQNVPKWAGNLWSLIVKTLILTGRQNMFLSSVWTGSCKRRYRVFWTKIFTGYQIKKILRDIV